jgi:hypothetical protein
VLYQLKVARYDEKAFQKKYQKKSVSQVAPSNKYLGEYCREAKIEAAEKDMAIESTDDERYQVSGLQVHSAVQW